MNYILFAVFILLLIILAIYFAMLNAVYVTVTLPWLGKFMDVPLIVVILSSVLLGVLIAFSLVFIKEVRRSWEQLRACRKNKRSRLAQEQYNQGLQLIASGRQKEAIECFNKLLDKHAEYTDACDALGDVYFSACNWDKAAFYHSKVLDLNSNNLGVMLKLANDYKQAGKIDRAIDILQKIIQKDEHNYTALTGLRDLYCEQGRWDKAYELQSKAVSLAKSKSVKLQETQVLLGLKYELAGNRAAQSRYPEAVKALKDIIKEDKSFLPAYIKLADIYELEHELTDAYQVLEKAYHKHPDPVLLKRLEEISLKHDDPQRAIKAYREGIKEQSQDFRIYLFLGMLYLKLEMLEEAKDQFDYLLRQGKDSPLLHYELAGIFERQADFKQSCSEYKRAFEAQERQLLRYTCAECGAQLPRWEGRCHHCGKWNSINWKV